MNPAPALVVLALGAGSPARADDTLPPPPTPPVPPDPYAPSQPPRFGADVSAGLVAGALLGSWPDAGLHGFGLLRYDAYLVDAGTPGTRLGLSLWGGRSLWPRQTFSEEDGPQGEPFDFLHFGAMTVLRGDPGTPITPGFGLGMSMVQVDGYADGPLTIPTLGAEAGARLAIGTASFVDVMARGHWGTTRSLTAPSLHEWWMVQLVVGAGLHVR